MLRIKKSYSQTKTFWVLLFVFVLFMVGELSFRLFLGLCDAPLYQSSNKYEYIQKPNQSGRRFGNFYHYNSYSQRSDEPDSSKITILGLGDSVIYGGVQSDQDSIATSLFSSKSSHFQMLNISAGSWGPDNCAAYLKEKGTFNAKLMFLVVSSHDAYDVMDFKPVVGIHRAYPETQYLLAWSELIDRYLLPRLAKFIPMKKHLDPDQKVVEGEILKKGRVFNPGFSQLKAMADSLGISLVVYLHATKTELHAGQYNTRGNQIIEWANENKVRLIKELDYSFSDKDYRDVIHMSNSGQRKLAKVMMENVK